MNSGTFSKFLEEFPELKAKSADVHFWIDEPLWEACQQVIDEATDKERISRLWVLLRKAFNDNLAISSGSGQMWFGYKHYHYEQLQQWALTYQIDEDSSCSSDDTASGDDSTASSDDDANRGDHTQLWIQALEHQEKEAEYHEKVERELREQQDWFDYSKNLTAYQQQVEAQLAQKWFEEQRRRSWEQQLHEMWDLERRNMRRAAAQQAYEVSRWSQTNDKALIELPDTCCRRAEQAERTASCEPKKGLRKVR